MKPKVLIIEDEKTIIDIIRINFELAGFEVYGCDHSPESMREALIELPDAIILDILMPLRSGWDVLEELQANPVTQQIPVIMCSVMKKPEEITRALEMGARAFITKPFDISHLLGTVTEVIGWKA